MCLYVCYLLQAHNDLIMSLEMNKFDVVASQSFNDEITGQLDAMLEKDVRIILGNFNESWAR
jgi:gamma-aminobutyric acid type B receptor